MVDINLKNQRPPSPDQDLERLKENFMAGLRNSDYQQEEDKTPELDKQGLSETLKKSGNIVYQSQPHISTVKKAKGGHESSNEELVIGRDS